MLRVLFVTFLVPFVTSMLSCPPGPEASAFSRLKSKLLCEYDSQERPVAKTKDIINITVSLDLKHIVSSATASRFEIHSWVTTSWIDMKLEWNPEEFDSISKILIPSSAIWIPDISVFNSDLSQVQVFSETTCVVRDIGLVMCVPSLRTPIYCLHKLTYWPFDTQYCKLVIGSWAQSEEISIQYDGQGYNLFEGVYEPNNDFDLINLTLYEKVNFCCSNITYSYLQYTFELKHHAGYFATIVIAPAFILAGLSLVSFWVRGITCRACLCCTAMIGDVLFLQFIGFHLSNAGESTPNIVIFYRDSMALTLLTIVIGLGVERLREQQDVELQAPGWLARVASWLQGSGGHAGQLLLGDSAMENRSSDAMTDSPQMPANCVRFATLLDRTAFLIILITYAILLAALLP